MPVSTEPQRTFAPVEAELSPLVGTGVATREATLPLAGDATCDEVRAEEVEHDWRRIVATAPSIFATYDWADAWWAAFGRGRERRTLAAKTGDGTTVGIVPLYREHVGPVRVLRFVGDGASDALGPVCEPAWRPAVATALRGYLDRAGDWDLLIGRTMPMEAEWGERLGALRLNRESSATLELRGRTWDEFLESRSSRFRQRRRAAERKLRERHGLRTYMVTEPEELPGAIEQLFELHRRLRAGRPSSFLRVADFHRDFMRRALDHGWLRLTRFELDGGVTAATLEYAIGGVVHGYQMGIDPRWRKVLDVRTVVALSLQRAFDDPSLTEFRVGRGGEEYKREYADADAGIESVVLGRGAIGSTLAVAMHRARDARPALRRLQDGVRQAIGRDGR